MSLFHFGKKKEEKESAAPCCFCGTENGKEESACCDRGAKTEPGCCGNGAKTEPVCCSKTIEGICCIKVLGAGCKSCHDQYEYAKQAVKEMGLSVEVEYITDMQKVMEYGVMSMPAIVVNEKVVSMGKILKTNDIVSMLKKQRG